MYDCLHLTNLLFIINHYLLSEDTHVTNKIAKLSPQYTRGKVGIVIYSESDANKPTVVMNRL
jgi:hypothetical protein